MNPLVSIPKLYIIGPFVSKILQFKGIHWWPMDSPHKGPVMLRRHFHVMMSPMVAHRHYNFRIGTWSAPSCATICAAILRGIHWWPMDSPHKGPVMLRRHFHVMMSPPVAHRHYRFRIGTWSAPSCATICAATEGFPSQRASNAKSSFMLWCHQW